MPALRLLCLAVLSGLMAATGGRAQSPPELSLQENDVTRIECLWDKEEIPPGFDPDKKPEKGLWHYDVFLPDGYNADKTRRYPCLFVSSPMGEAKRFLPLYKDWLQRNGWLAVMLVESRNGTIEPCLGNFLSAHDDALKRLRIIDTMKAAAGMSGGARMSSLFAQIRPGFRGIFLQGAGFSQTTAGRYWMHDLPADGSLAVYLTIGNKDPNAPDAGHLRDSLPPAVPYHPHFFDGGHVPPPPGLAADAMDWLARRMWLSAAADKSARAEVPALVKRLAARVPAESSPVSRYALLQDIAELVKTYALAPHPDIAPLMAVFSRQFAEVKRDPAVVLEIKAASALSAMRELQRKTGARAAKLSDMDARKALWTEFCASCESAAAPFSETKSGRECLALARGLAP